MRCNPKKCCGQTVKYAGKIARKRKICGSCMYAIRKLGKDYLDKDCINNTQLLEKPCKIRK